MKIHSGFFHNVFEHIKGGVQEISIDEVKTAFSKKPGSFRVIDVREDSEWATGHLPSAIHINKAIIEQEIKKAIPDVASRLVLYCAGGYRSALAAANLQKLGYRHVYSMAGGIRAWVNAGLPLAH